MTRIKMHIFKVKLSFYPPGEVKYGLQNEVLTISNENTIAIRFWCEFFT